MTNIPLNNSRMIKGSNKKTILPLKNNIVWFFFKEIIFNSLLQPAINYTCTRLFSHNLGFCYMPTM